MDKWSPQISDLDAGKTLRKGVSTAKNRRDYLDALLLQIAKACGREFADSKGARPSLKGAQVVILWLNDISTFPIDDTPFPPPIRQVGEPFAEVPPTRQLRFNDEISPGVGDSPAASLDIHCSETFIETGSVVVDGIDHSSADWTEVTDLVAFYFFLRGRRWHTKGYES